MTIRQPVGGYNLGTKKLTDAVEGSPLDAGKLVLSPTRTYAPVIKRILDKHRGDIHGMVRGGGGCGCLLLLLLFLLLARRAGGRADDDAPPCLVEPCAD